MAARERALIVGAGAGLSAAMLIPYMIISIMGGGTVLAHISDQGGAGHPMIPYWLGCAVVAVVVTLGGVVKFAAVSPLTNPL